MLTKCKMNEFEYAKWWGITYLLLMSICVMLLDESLYNMDDRSTVSPASAAICILCSMMLISSILRVSYLAMLAGRNICQQIERKVFQRSPCFAMETL